MVKKKVEAPSHIKFDCGEEGDKFGKGVSFKLIEDNGLDPQEMNSVTMSELLGVEVKTVRIDNSFNAVFVIDTKKDKKGK